MGARSTGTVNPYELEPEQTRTHKELTPPNRIEPHQRNQHKHEPSRHANANQIHTYELEPVLVDYDLCGLLAYLFFHWAE